MPKLWETILNLFNFIGDNSGCHQIPERCITIKGYTFPLCARCTGILLSMPFSILYGLKKQFKAKLLFLLIPMGIDWWLTKVKITKGSNKRRFVTGLLGGFAIHSIQIMIIIQMLGGIKALLCKHSRSI